MTRSFGVASFIVAAACCLSACEGGIDGTGAGIIAAGGAVALGAIAGSAGGSDSDGPAVTISTNPHDNNYSLKLSDLSQVKEPGFSISPPAWILGNWTGFTDGGQRITAIFSEKVIAFGDDNTQTSLNDSAGISIAESDISPSAYGYRIVDTRPGFEAIQYVHDFQNFEDGISLNFSLSTDSPQISAESAILTRSPGNVLLKPPQWLHGQWDGPSETRFIKSDDISGEYKDDNTTFSYSDLLGNESAIFQVLTVSDQLYAISFGYPNENGEFIHASESFEYVDENRVIHKFLGYTEVLTRQ